jgi:hypothetical protein
VAFLSYGYEVKHKEYPEFGTRKKPDKSRKKPEQVGKKYLMFSKIGS